MKVIKSGVMVRDCVLHPYDSNPDFMAKINTFYYSKDKKFIGGYWEAPEGWFTGEMGEQSEINYVIEGEIDLVSNGRKITAKKGDCFLVESKEKVKWMVKKPIKTVFFIYPAGKELANFFESLAKKG